MSRVLLPLVLFSVSLCAPTVSKGANISIDTVSVGNASNANDPATGNLYGGVDHSYRIGATEVTNDQYVAFLNEKAKSDPMGLYSASMGFATRGGITQSGSSGSFTYSVKTDMGDKPVNYVTWYDAIRFVNWLHNGQGSGDTETGAYTILGGTTTPSNGLGITRNVGATWFLTSENEWYRAAYHQPSDQGGDADNYWSYPTRSNSAPALATADVVGNISNPGANVANYELGADWNGENGNLTTVGGAGPSSGSYYGTADQGGNVSEWNEALISGVRRGLRGGSFDAPWLSLQASDRSSLPPTIESINIGFRVAAVIPEPSTGVMAAIGFGLLCLLRKRFKQP